MGARAVPAPLAQIPNGLTVARLALIPAFVAVLLAAEGGMSVAAAVIFGIAGITDQIDGFLARRWHVESEFGKFADPLADRLMIDAAVVLLWLDGRLPWVALLVILARDGLLLGGYRLVADKGYEFEVNALGKVATWVLYFALTATMLTEQGTDWPYAVFWAGLVLAAAAALMYVARAWREIRR